jgi:hypothetical protein
VGGKPGAYRFRVTLRSPETGCDRYADWWEVLRPDGTLVYRRILAHSHPDEQPFTRGGGPVPAQPSDELIIRAHMHPGGYGGTVAVGTAEGGFELRPGDPSFHPELAGAKPLPDGCAF